MTDSEIIKALGEMSKVLDLINHQKSEIDKLKEENDVLKQQTYFAYEVEIPQYRALSTITKCKAIKEFWGELKSRNTTDKRIVSVETGDNLLKEMVGE